MKTLINCTLLFFGLLLVLGSCDTYEYEPSAPYQGEFDTDIVSWIATVDDLSLLSEALQRTGLDQALSGGEYTLFAPGNISFELFLQDTTNTYTTLEDVPVEELTNLLQYHVLEGRYLREDFSPEVEEYPTLADGSLRVNYSDIDPSGRYYVMSVNGKPVATQNIKFTNGVVHTFGMTGMEKEGRDRDVGLLTP